jgi:hypothetical protein
VLAPLSNDDWGLPIDDSLAIDDWGIAPFD